MANLIITIISIGLVAVAAIMAIYYGGQAFQSAQVNAMANAMITEAQQTLAAQRLWATNNNQPDATNANYGTLVASKDLTIRPYGVALQLGIPASTLPISSSAIGNAIPVDCLSYNGYISALYQEPFTYNNGNYVVYSFRFICTGSTAFTTSDTDTTTINNSFVQLAKAVNGNLQFVPTASNVMTSSGIPRMTVSAIPLSSTTPGAWFVGNNWQTLVMLDSNGNIQTNYCYYPFVVGYQYISCVFGPS